MKRKHTFLNRCSGATVILMIAVFGGIGPVALTMGGTGNWVNANESTIGAKHGARAKALEGTWDVTVTLRSCATGDVIRAFPRLITAVKGGTLHESAAAGTAAFPALRTTGHGVWDHSTQWSFTYAVQFLRLNADGSPAGKVKERRTVEMDESGDSFTATGTGEVYNAAGTLIASSCATEEGARFQ